MITLPTLPTLRAVALTSATIAAAISGCQSRSERSGEADSAARASQAATPAAQMPTPPQLSGNLRQLAWIEGTWRGTGVGQPPFYERYRLVDDSTLVEQSFADSTLATVTETSRFALRAGALTSIPGATGDAPDGAARWYGSALSNDSVRFEPLVRARNSFVWQRGPTPDEWLARLSWPASGSGAARTVSYDMRRWR